MRSGGVTILISISFMSYSIPLEMSFSIWGRYFDYKKIIREREGDREERERDRGREGERERERDDSSRDLQSLPQVFR